MINRPYCYFCLFRYYRIISLLVKCREKFDRIQTWRTPPGVLDVVILGDMSLWCASEILAARGGTEGRENWVQLANLLQSKCFVSRAMMERESVAVPDFSLLHDFCHGPLGRNFVGKAGVVRPCDLMSAEVENANASAESGN